jgi:hypothetical protein
MKSMGKARGLRHNNALQRTRSAPLRSPLSFETLGARSIGWATGLLLTVVASIALADDIGPPEPLTFEQQFGQSKIVAVARIEAGATGSYSSLIYRARVGEGFKGAENRQVIYFWGGNVGDFNAYGIGQVYLLMLRKSWKPVSDVLESFAPKSEPLYESICLSGPVLLWRNPRALVGSPFPVGRSIFLFGCPDPPLTLHPRSIGPSSMLFHSWVDRDEMVEYLKKLAGTEEGKSRAGA